MTVLISGSVDLLLPPQVGICDDPSKRGTRCPWVTTRGRNPDRGNSQGRTVHVTHERYKYVQARDNPVPGVCSKKRSPPPAPRGAARPEHFVRTPVPFGFLGAGRDGRPTWPRRGRGRAGAVR